MGWARIAAVLILSGGFRLHAGPSSYVLVTEPDQGLNPIYSLIRSAKSTLDITMYELADAQAEQLLAQAAAAGVRVRVILDQNLEKNNNAATYQYLSSHGVQVHWANPKYSATHQKTIIADGSTAAIMTLNLTSRYYASSRDFAVIENDPGDLAAIESTFEADFSNLAITPPIGDDLVWSPTNSQSVILGLIDDAQSSLLVENEEMGDAAVVNALVNAAGRGVRVQVVMTNKGNEYSSEFGQLVSAGSQVSTYASNAPLYIHAKVILADYGSAMAEAFIGSENFSVASLTRNRELGLTTSDPSALQSIFGTLTSDFNGATRWPNSEAGMSVVNAASLQAGIAAGGWISIFGANLAAVTDDWTHSIVDGRLPTSLDGVSVTAGGHAAYVAYVSATQINAIAPEVDAGTVSVVVRGPNGTGAHVTAVAETIQPAFFQWGNYAAATDLDYSAATHVAPGEVVILWGTGFGPTTPAAPAGIAVPLGAFYQTTSPVKVTLGNIPVVVYSAALAPGFAALYQVAIQVPESLPDGDYPVVTTVSGVQSPSNVLLTVLR